MKLYEFNYRNGKLTKRVLEKGCFEGMFCSQIRKSEIGNIRCGSFWGFTTISEEDNAEDFLVKVVEMQKERVKGAEATFAKQKAILEKLVNKDYILVEKQMY